MLIVYLHELSTKSKITNHWIVMLTYLQHSDPTIPHYRTGEWNWLRGALATVDRPLLGWIGRFFLHNVRTALALSPCRILIHHLQISHDHVAHHLFPNIPFCKSFCKPSSFSDPDFLPDNQPEVTRVIKPILKDDYNYDSTVRPNIHSSFRHNMLTNHMGNRTPFMHSIVLSIDACSSKTAAEFCSTRIERVRQVEQ